MELSDEHKAVLLRVLAHLNGESDAGPAVQAFRVKPPDVRSLLDELVVGGYLTSQTGRYQLTAQGLIGCPSPEAEKLATDLNALLAALQQAYREAPGTVWTSAELGARLDWSAHRASQQLARLLALDGSIASSYDPNQLTGIVQRIQLAEAVLDAAPIPWPEDLPDASEGSQPTRTPIVTLIEIAGYRPFRDFKAMLSDLTVIIGANASGKSSLFDLIRLLSFAVSSPLPPEIDPNGAGRRVFHAGGPERIAIGVVLDLGGREPLRYELEIAGPIGSPFVLSERLATVQPLHNGTSQPFKFLDFRNGRGVVRNPRERALIRPDWKLPPNELALRRALDPTLATLSRFRDVVASWRVYADFDVSPTAEMRRPVPSEPSPLLATDGSNVSAVLSWLVSEHAEIRTELESIFRSAIPGFIAVGAKAWGGKGMWMGTWREDGVADELTLADLSDGTLRLLCLAVLCLSPNVPSLVCIDEPELGLHPRVLPVLADLLRSASTRCQVIVATHSPYLLSHLKLDEIAVMRKEDGHAVFTRPSDSAGLRAEVEELGGAALAQLHCSDELETRS